MIHTTYPTPARRKAQEALLDQVFRILFIAGHQIRRAKQSCRMNGDESIERRRRVSHQQLKATRAPKPCFASEPISLQRLAARLPLVDQSGCDDTDVMQPNSEQMERAVAALIPFVREWGLPLNPEDLCELAAAVLVHYDSDESWESLDAAVRGQLAEYTRRRAAIEDSYRQPE
jgi:hypothetical protein